MDMDIPLPGEEVPLPEKELPPFVPMVDIPMTDIPMPDIPMPEDDPPESPRRASPDFLPASADSTMSEPSQEEDVDLDDISPPLPPVPAPATSEDEADDPDRYSPSVPMEEDDLPMIPDHPGSIPPLLPPPLPPPSLAPLPPASAPRSLSPSPSPEREPSPPPRPTTKQARSLVLGKTQAKKRLLAFSMTKQGGGAGVSFNLAKKSIISKESAKTFTEEKEEGKKKPPKKGSVDKARDTISEIEELKRKEMQLLENMHTLHPRWGMRDAHNLPSALPLQLADNLDSLRSTDIVSLVGEVLAKKLKRDAAEKGKDRGRSRSPSDDRRRKSKKSEREKERRRKKKLPKNWNEFKTEGHKMRHFRRFKYEVEKNELREKKERKHKRGSRSRSRSGERLRSKKDKSPGKRSSKINLLETPMVVKKVLVALDIRGTTDVDFPSYLVRYTKSRPPVSFCENPVTATYHLPSRNKMLSTVPRDIEEIIVRFLNSIRPKRLRPKPKVEETETKEGMKNVENSESLSAEGKEEKNEVVCIDDEEIVTECKTELADKSSTVTEVEVITNEEETIESDHNEKKEDEGDKNDDEKRTNADKEIIESDGKEEEDEKESGELEDTVDSKIDVDQDNSKKEKEIEIDICNLSHRGWFQNKSDWLVVHVPLEDEEDVEIEDLDVLPTVMKVDVYKSSKESNRVDLSFEQKNNFKPRSRNISQSSANVINEELEPIIKSAIRSKWDSDYEESEEEKKPNEIKKQVIESLPFLEFVDNENSQTVHEIQDVSNDNLGVVPMEVEEDEKFEDESDSEKLGDIKWKKDDSQEDLVEESQEEIKQDPPDVVEKLASEYEEFMKMLGSENQQDEAEDLNKGNKCNDSANLESNWEEENSDKDTFAHNESVSVNDDSQLQNESLIEKEQIEESVVAPAEKQIWERKRAFSNRSRSLSSTRSLDIKNIEEALLKHKILSEALLRKKKKGKVQGSKINKKKLKEKNKKSKKKHKKQSSSDSSSSSSSSSSDSSSSSSSSSNDSSSDSSSSSGSTSSSSDSSIDMKKLKKQQKLKKLKAKLKRKKKKKHDSSSESSDTSDEETEKKRKKKKAKLESKQKKKKINDKISKGKKGKKSKENKFGTEDNELSQSVFKKRSKKKRKKSDDEESDDIPKKKRSKLDLKFEEAIKLQKKDKTEKSKKSSKTEKEKRKKDTSSKNEDNLKKKGPKDKLTLVEFDTENKKTKLKTKSKDKKHKKSEKKEKDLFLEFGENLKASKKSKLDEIGKEGGRDGIKKTGIKMSEEDFEISNHNPRESEKDLYGDSTNSISQKVIVEEKIPFLGQNKRLTEEDFDKELIESTVEKNSKYERLDNQVVENYQSETKESDKLFLSADIKELDKSKKKSKKEKKKKEKKDKDSGAINIDVDKKKKKKKKDKKSKRSLSKCSKEERDEKGENTYSKFVDLEPSVLLNESFLSKPKNSELFAEHETSLNNLEVHRMEQKKCVEHSQASGHEHSNSKLSLSPSRKSGPMNDWSDDSETRGCFIKEKSVEDLHEEVLDEVVEEKRNVVDIQLPEIPGLGFDTRSRDGDDETSSLKRHMMGECEQKMEQLDEDFRIAKRNQERDSFFENLLKSNEKSTPITSSTKSADKKISSVTSESIQIEEKHVGNNSSTSEDFNSQKDSFVLEKDIPIKDLKEIRVFSEFEKINDVPNKNLEQEFQNTQSPKGNDESERYSPTLDLDVMSPGSNEKMESDMSLDSTELGDSDSNKREPNINMLDIPLPPSGLPLQSVPIMQPPLPPVPAPVPPPLLPVPAPSFKNILNLPPKPPLPPPELKKITAIEEQPKVTEFQTTVTELKPNLDLKSVFSDPLKIPITKKLSFGKPTSKLKPMNIFEDDEAEAEDENNQQGLNKLSFDDDENSIQKSELDLAVEKAEEKLKNKNVGDEKSLSKPVKELSLQRKEREIAIQQMCDSLKHPLNENVTECVKNTNSTQCHDKSTDETNTQKESLEQSFLNISAANVEVENARDAWKDSDESSNVTKQVHDINTKITGDQKKDNLEEVVEKDLAEVTVKEEVLSDNQDNDENVDSTNFDSNLEIKQEPESETSQEVLPDKTQVEEPNPEELEKNKRLLEDERKKKEYEDYHSLKKREPSKERRDRPRRESSRERRRRSRSRDRRRDRSRERHRRDSPDRRNRRRDRSRERSRRNSSRDRRREKSPRGRREASRDRSPRRMEVSGEIRSSLPEKRDFRDGPVEKRIDEPNKFIQDKQSKVSPHRRSPSMHKNRSPSPNKRSLSPLLKSPLYQKRPLPSHYNRSPSPYRSSPSRRIAANRSPSPSRRPHSPQRRLLSPERRPLSPQRRLLSPQRSPQRRALSPQRRPISPQRKPISPQRRPISPQRRQISPQRRLISPQRRTLSPQRRPLSPQRRRLSPQRRPPSPQSPYRSPYRSPSPYGRQSPLKISSPTKRYLSPSRRPLSPWQPPSPPKRPSPLRNVPSPTRRPLSPWKPPSPPSVPKSYKRPKPKSPQKSVEYCGRNPSPLGFKRSLADSTISDSDLPPIKKITRNAVLSPKRLPLDDRIELELGVKKSPPPPPHSSSYPGFQSFYQIPVHDCGPVQIQSANQPRRNTNLVQPPRLDWDASQQLLRQGKSTKVLQSMR